MFHPHWRDQALAGLDSPFDLVVIGGGITGCGVLLDAAQRGLRTLLIERDDIAAGTSSRSSKLIHGGLRYLKQMQFRITRLACRERDRMAALSPHLVRPIPFLYPASRGDKTPGWQVDMGLRIYDLLTTRPEKHQHPDLGEVERLAPDLDTSNLERALLFTDGMADDAQLTLAVAATGFAYGGLILTRATPEEAFFGPDRRIQGLVVRDTETGTTHRVETHLAINASGVWVDEIRERFGLSGRNVRPSRGTHIIFPADRLPLDAAISLLAPEDGRPVFCVPHPEGVLVGTTDIFHDGKLDDPRPTQAEVDYLLRAVRTNFPSLNLDAKDVVGCFAGLRPILDSDAETPSEASRDEDVWEERGLLSISGGKLTTWRAMAEEVVNTAIKLLPEERRVRTSACATEGTALAGLTPPDLPQRLARAQNLPEPVARGIAKRLCGEAWTALRLARDPAELIPLVDGANLCAAEVRAHLQVGAVVRLEDLLLRRVRYGMWNPALARDLIPLLRPLFVDEFEWDDARWAREEEACAAALEAWSPLPAP